MLNSYPHTTWVRFWGSVSLVESEWCHYVIVETDSHLKLRPTSKLDIYKVIEHIAMPIHWHWHKAAAAFNSCPHTMWVRFWGHGSLVESKWCHNIMVEADSHLNHCFPHPYYTHTMCLSTWYAVHGHMAVALNSYTRTNWVRFWGSVSLAESKWCHYVIIEGDSHLKLLPASTLDI